MARKRRENDKQDMETASKQSARQERRINTKKNSKDSGDEDVQTLKTQLAQFGLTLREVPGDGNCLFRALGDQLDGHMGNHLRHRRDTAQYMSDHRKDFEPFVEDDVPFDKHLNLLGEPGTYVGNDAIVAFARMHQVTVVIHQPSAPLWRVDGTQWEDSSRDQERKLRSKQNQPNKELHIAYHGGDHYDSVRKIGDTGHLPANIKLQTVTEPPPKAKVTSSPPEADYVNDAEVLEELTDLEKEAMELSGCADLFVVRQLLENNCYNLDATVEDLIGLTVSSTSCETATSADDKPSSTTRRKQLPARKQERQKKLERKKRATEERNRDPATEPQPIQTKFQCLSI